VFEPAYGDIEETVSLGDGRATESSKLRGYGEAAIMVQLSIKGVN
jgi:hypothetical protein